MDDIDSNSKVSRSIIALFSGTVLGIGGLGLGFVLSIAAAGILLISDFELTPIHQIVITLVFVQGIGCIGVTLLYSRLRPRAANIIESSGVSIYNHNIRIGYGVPSKGDIIIIIFGYFAALGGAMAAGYIGSVIIEYLGESAPQNAAAEIGIQNPEILLLLIPASILLIGPGEELLFRGVVQGRLREVFSPVVAILTATIIFSGLHFFALTGGSTVGNVIVLGLLTFPALVFGISYEYTDNIVVPALIHGLYNATLFTGLYLAIRFGSGV